MEPLLLCLLVAACLQHLGTDLAYAVRGKTPPRLEWKMQRAQQRAAAAPGSAASRVKRAVGEYFGDLGHDAVRTAQDRHRRVYARRRNRRAQKWNTSQRLSASRPIVEEPDVPDLQEVAERELDRQEQPTGRDTDVEPKTRTCPECGEAAQEAPPTRWAPAYGERPSWSHLDGEPLCPVVTDEGYRPAQPQESPVVGEAPTTPSHFSEGDTEPMSTPTSVTPNSETTSLAQALAYTQAMAESAQQGAASAEQSAAHLEAGEVSGQSLTHLASAREHLTQAAAAFNAAHQELSKQTSIRDAYAAVGDDAGSKQFVTAE